MDLTTEGDKVVDLTGQMSNPPTSYESDFFDTFSDEYDYGFSPNSSAHESDFLSPPPQFTPRNSRSFKRNASCSTSTSTSREASCSETDETQHFTEIPPPPFSTPPKLKPIERVMRDNPGKDVTTLRNLTTALAREAIFGRDDLAQKSLSGRKNTGILDEEKLSYIKTLVRSRVPEMSKTEFEATWKMCRASLSKSCQTLRARKKW